MTESRKVVEYLLNAAHADNGGKAAFFNGFGFHEGNADEFVLALQALARSGDLVRELASRHGQKYVVDGSLASPGGKAPRVRTVWIVDKGARAPRFVTAYPCEE